MVSRQTSIAWRRAAAAARLAALYTVGAVALFLLGELAFEGPARATRTFAALPAPAAMLGLIAFALLALARRAGFAVLWAALAGGWAWVLAAKADALDIPMAFLGWSVLALPLYTLCALGAPPPQRRLRTGLVPAAWAVLAAVGVYLYYGLSFDLRLSVGALERALAAAAVCIWGPVPFLIAAFALGRFWVGTRRAIYPPSAA